jgi:hypothetical protein
LPPAHLLRSPAAIPAALGAAAWPPGHRGLRLLSCLACQQMPAGWSAGTLAGRAGGLQVEVVGVGAVG